MRIPTPAAAAIAGALITASLGVAGAAVAAPSSQHASARADWKQGANAAAAEQGKFWREARHELPARDAHERADLHALTAIPETGATAKDRKTAERVTRELNGFFRTPGLYGVKDGNAKKIARADWIKSFKVSAARANVWLGGANDELAGYGKRYHAERAELTSLKSLPLTSLTAKQMKTAHHDVHALDRFFHTSGLGN
jgi:hypothetical protein